MKRLFALIALITTLIGSAGLCLAGGLGITKKASDWLKAAKLPSHELKEESLSLLSEGEQADLLIALAYTAGYKEGVLAGATMTMGIEKTKVKKILLECPFLDKTRDAYDEVRWNLPRFDGHTERGLQ